MAESLVKKLGIKPGNRVLILNAPEGYAAMLGDLPDGVTLTTDADGTYDFVQVFVRSKADADQYGQKAIQALKPGGILYFAYPKLSSNSKADINRDSGWDVIKGAGWDTVRAISIDETWSALRFRPLSEIGVKSR